MALIPWHWAFRGPGKPVPAGRLFRTVDVRGGHAATLRRLLRVGPFGLYVLRYRPGLVDQREEREPIP